MSLLSVNNLTVRAGARELVHGVSFDLAKGEVLAANGSLHKPLARLITAAATG